MLRRHDLTWHDLIGLSQPTRTKKGPPSGARGGTVKSVETIKAGGRVSAALTYLLPLVGFNVESPVTTRCLVSIRERSGSAPRMEAKRQNGNAIIN